MRDRTIPPLSHAELVRVLIYNPRTGTWRWLISPRPNIRAGSTAGATYGSGYRHIKLLGRQYKAARLAWFYVTGEWPPPGYEVDHKNGDTLDDRWDNLRLATRSQNACNQGKRRGISPVELKGVGWDGARGLYRARIKGDRQLLLGRYVHEEEAHQAYREAARKLHGRFANLGMSEEAWRRRWSWFMCSRVWIEA
jgi:hypothetical protein